jgi:hypothetical protein
MPVVKNEADCCVYKPTPESEVIVNEVGCTTDECNTGNTVNGCGIETLPCAGTIAGCNSQSAPHVGVIFEMEGSCRKFAYWTSNNTKEYENVCGGMDKLSCEEVEVPCAKDVKLTTESCDCFENKGGAGGVVDAAKLAELEAKIAANEDNTVVNTIIEGDKVYNVLEDGTKVEVNDIAVDLEGKLVKNN